MGITSCPDFVHWYLKKRNCPLDWVFTVLFLMCAFTLLIAAFLYMVALSELLDLPKGEKSSQASAFGCFSGLVFMTWLNYRKAKTKKK